MESWYENINSVGDLVSAFIIKLYGRENAQFSADSVYLNSHWLTSILKEKFGIEKLDTKGFKWNTRDIMAKQFGKEISKKYLNHKTFNVEEMRIFLNEKYKDYEI